MPQARRVVVSIPTLPNFDQSPNFLVPKDGTPKKTKKKKKSNPKVRNLLSALSLPSVLSCPVLDRYCY